MIPAITPAITSAQTATDAEVAAAAAYRRQRHDGWTPDRQRIFLEAVADGHSVDAACRLAGMSPSSAYAFRRRAAGAAFNLGWRAAGLLARERVADALLTRAIDGYTETITRPDGSVVERLRFDNRLAATMLARLDRMAEASEPASAAANASARLVAQEFDAYLDLIERDAGPARAGLFVATRDPALLDMGVEADLSPVLALARSDRFMRTGAATAGEVDIADLDPDARAGWTAEQWGRAEAAGLVCLAPPPPADDIADSSPLSPLHPGAEPDAEDEEAELEDETYVWFDDDLGCWMTAFPPPPGFDGEEEGRPSDPDYCRSLTDEEAAVVIPWRRREEDADARAQATLRDAWFAHRAPLT